MPQFDTSPGGLDGPPPVIEVEDKVEGPVEKVARLAAQGLFATFLVVFMLAVVVGLAWGIAWMITHFPGV